MTLLSNVLTKTIDDAVAMQKLGGVDIIGIPTGITELDRLLGGFRQGEYYVLAGRTSSGKSSLAFNFAMHAAAQNYRVGYISLEMSKSVLSLRYLAAQTGMSANYIERGRFTTSELARMQEAASVATHLDLHIYDESMSVEDVASYLQEAQEHETPLDILFVDYVSLFSNKGDSMHERMTYLSGELRKYSRDFQIPIVTLAQLNRNVEHRENKIPILSDLAESGRLEQDASAIIFCYRHHYYEMMFNQAKSMEIENDALLTVAKNRHGPTASIPASFIPKQMRWEDRR